MDTEFKETPLAKYAARLQEWQRNVVIKYKPGRYHQNADGPSRLPVQMDHDCEDTDDIIVPDGKYVSRVDMDRADYHRVACAQAVELSLNNLSKERSIPPWEAVYEGATYTTSFLDKVREGQRTEKSCQEMVQFMTNSLRCNVSMKRTKELQEQVKNMVVKEGLLFRVAEFAINSSMPKSRVAQLYIPKSCRKTILHALHEHPTSAHVGSSKMFQMVRSRYYWPGYEKDVERWCTTCSLCQRYKKTKPRNHGLLHPKRLVGPMHTLNIDIVSKFPLTRGYSMVLTVINTFTRWLWLIPLRSKGAVEVADALYEYVIQDVAVVRNILSDNGTEFNNKVMERLCARMGMTHKNSSVEHPQTNSQAERIHRHMTKSLAMLAAQKPKKWLDHLKEVQFAYRMSPVDGLGMSPHAMLYGREPLLPVDILTSDPVTLAIDEDQYHLTFPKRMQAIWDMIMKQSSDNNEKNKKYYDQGRVQVEFASNTKVLLYRDYTDDTQKELGKLRTPWRGPFVVVGRGKYSDRTVQLEDDEGRRFFADVTDVVPYYPTRLPELPDEDEDRRFAHEKPKSNSTDKTEDSRPLMTEEPLETSGRGDPGKGEVESIPDRMPDHRHFLDLDRSVQREIIEQAIEVINSTNDRVEVKISSIPKISRKYPYGVFARKTIRN